ncbi:sulfurtransferase [Cellulophaga sp. HaHaR_3_176]|uniref:sulfurtransferase n=1 Tax=Cellulophaga sp. HaHaR_3_176 TaxID=1942464 RepID=UPI001C1F8F5B|nr:sulfurtransferase [Cellulophaga sp. HaHaR_3_176]QWX82731.1 sulfurtransferase [Cellulophaga sp. HaHaR_3_176]
MDSLVTVDWLKNHLSDSDLIILDASSVAIAAKEARLDSVKIAGARFFDLKNDFSDTDSKYPNTLPSAEKFQLACQNLGINSTSKIVVYDNLGVYWSPRVLWMFNAMGHSDIAVLDGGLPEWMSSGLPVENRIFDTSNKGDFKTSFDKSKLVNFTSVLENTTAENTLLIDARSSGRFDGTAPEPRKDLRSGHIPNSINIPYENVLNNGKFKSVSELKLIFKDVEKENRPLVFSCGSGITACIILLASKIANITNEKAVFDGSWTEWAQRVK